MGVALIVMVCIVLNSICFYFFERQENKELTLWDCFWLSFTTITTVGYGDYSASTVGGRMATMILLYGVGLASFPYVVTQIVDTTVERHNDRRYGSIDCRDLVQEHIIIVNFPSERKVVAIIEQLSSDPVTSHRPIVLLTDNIEELPFNRPNVHFVRGAPLKEESWERANIEKAYAALILAPKIEENVADAITASTVSLVETLHPEIRTIAECSSVEHLSVFRSFNCDAVIPTNNIAAKVLAQEVRDHGLSHAVAELLTESEGSELYSETIDIEGINFGELQSRLLELKAEVILVGIIRDKRHQINPPPDLQIQQTDRLILIGNRRSDWESIHERLLNRRAT
jgi:voltage-gated potassium channel